MWGPCRLGDFPDIRKARVGSPPGFLNARFFPALLLSLCSADFPPEIRSESFGSAWMRLVSRSAEAPRNEIRMSPIRDIKRKLKVNSRPSGRKIGRKGVEARKV